MSKMMNENVGVMMPDNLVYDSKHPIDVKSVKIRSGQGLLKRGTVLSLSTGDEGDKNHVVLGTTAEVDEILTADAVLCDDIDTGSVVGTTVFATAYRSGHFSRNSLLVKDAYSLTQDDETELRNGGIFLSHSF